MNLLVAISLFLLISHNVVADVVFDKQTEDRPHHLVELNGSKFENTEIAYGNDRSNITLHLTVSWDSVRLDSFSQNGIQIKEIRFPFKRQFGYKFIFDDEGDNLTAEIQSEKTLKDGTKQRIWLLPWKGTLEIEFYKGLLFKNKITRKIALFEEEIIIVEQ